MRLAAIVVAMVLALPCQAAPVGSAEAKLAVVTAKLEQLGEVVAVLVGKVNRLERELEQARRAVAPRPPAPVGLQRVTM